jgi:hypothetical protein
MFSRVQPGFPWWWWFTVDGRKEVYRVVRDGSGTLWVNDNGIGCKLDEFHGKALEPVPLPKDDDTHETLCQTAEEVLLGDTDTALIYMVQQQRTRCVGDEFLDIWEAVQPFFTFNGAETYLYAHDHELQNPRVMEMSAEDNPEWRAIQKLFFKTQG